MILLNGLLKIDKDLQTPVYLQITNGIIKNIRQGVLKPGSRLPSSRALAESLKVHRQTVVSAYEELDAQSWIAIYPRKGLFVAKNLPEVAPRPIRKVDKPSSFPAKTHFFVDQDRVPFPELFKKSPERNLVFNDGFPDTRLAPVELLIREYRRFANYRFTPKYLMYGPERGSENLRNELARFLSETRGLHASPETILITKGVQMALYLTAQVLLSKNDTVIVPDPGYLAATEVFKQAGARVELCPMDEQGIDINTVEAICKKKKVRLLYVIPHHHRPTAATLSSERRMRLLELGMKYEFAIVEDDYDFDFHYASSPILPLASADYYGSVVYIGSFCKTIAPGIRIGFLVAPQNLVVQAARLRRLIDRQGEQLMEEAIANLLKNGDIGRHLKKANKIYHERRDILSELLKEHLSDHIEFNIPDGGFAIWMKYLNGLTPEKIAEKASEMGLTLSNGKLYYHDPAYRHPFVRLGFASLNDKEMEQAVGILKKAVKKLL